MTVYRSIKALVDKAIDLDVNAFLIKPVSSTALSRRLGNMLETASDGSWLKSAEEYSRVDVTNSSDSKRSARKHPMKDPATEQTSIDDQDPPASGPRPNSKTLAQYEIVYSRISGLKGKFTDSDLAGDISVGVSGLIEEIGLDNATEVISVFDDLERRGLFKLDEIAGVLNSGPRRFSEKDLAGLGSSRPRGAKRQGRPSRLSPNKGARNTNPKSRPASAAAKEFFCSLDAIPVSATLSRDIHTVDGRLFIKSGIEVTPLIASIFIYLDSLGVLGLEKRGNVEFSGIYVRRPESRSKNIPGPESVDVSNKGTPSVSVGGRSKAVSVNEVLPGSILAHDVYTTDGRSYLPAGADLTPRITTLLRDLCALGNISSEIRIVD